MLSPADQVERAARRIPVSGGKAFVLVDDCDFADLSRWRWSLNGAGYACRKSEGHVVFMHRQILGLQRLDGKMADHIDGDPLNNQRANLRVVTNAGNGQNRAPRTFGTSRFRGVYWDRAQGKWKAGVKINYTRHNLGSFDDEVEAARAAEAYRREHMPFARPDPELAAVESEAAA